MSVNPDFTVAKLGDLTINSPLKETHFETDEAKVIYKTDPEEIAYEEKHGGMLCFEKAGPREMVYHDPSWSKAAILTAGGLCPGLNDVIKGLTMTLVHRYNVPLVYGIRYGYRGLIPEFNFEPKILTEENVDDIHEDGGTILGSSRGRQDESTMVETLVRMNINMLFCIGGDGTLRCAHDVCKEIKRRKLSISVVCIPKTIDNDICFIDKTFGFETAVYATNSVITAAHNEAKGAYNGVGLIHVMGRDSGFIAAYAALANSHVNYCLVPEEQFCLEGGANALFTNLKRRLEKRHHAVIIVAEGAGQEFFNGKTAKHDKSGNKLHNNIGLYLKEKLPEVAKTHNLEMSLKYFDPTYTIRSLPAYGTDAVFCLMLAQNAVHAAMAGRTDIVVGHWNGCFTHVPISMATSERKLIEVKGPLWRSVRSVTWPEYND
jgi:6-phosphofructokinase 1